MTTLRPQMIQDMVIGDLSGNTQEACVRAVAELAQSYGRSPDRTSGREIQNPMRTAADPHRCSHQRSHSAILLIGSS
jgi:hypothetical protein